MDTKEKPPYLTFEVKTELKPGRLERLSENMMDQHWMLYKGYVTNCNLLSKTLWEAARSGVELNEPKTAEIQRRVGFEYNGMILHEYYFGALKNGVAEPAVSSFLYRKFLEDFGGLAHWKKQVSEIGRMRGIGWVITYLEPSSGRLLNAWVSDHEVGNITGFVPIVTMDVWEHAYVADYGASGAGRADYIQAFLKNLNWKVVSERVYLGLQSRSLPRMGAGAPDKVPA